MERYEIRVVGHLHPRRVHALGCQALVRLPSGDSVLVFEAIDQAALYGLIAQLRDAGLELVTVERTSALNEQIARRPVEGRREKGGTGHV
jgi:hypothetical protein